MVRIELGGFEADDAKGRDRVGWERLKGRELELRVKDTRDARRRRRGWHSVGELNKSGDDLGGEK